MGLITAIQTSFSQSMTASFAGMLADGYPDPLIIPGRNNESSAAIAFGLMVKWERSTDDDGVKILTANSEKVAGVVVYSPSYAKDINGVGDLNSTGLKPGSIMNVLRKGRVWVYAGTSVLPGDPLYVRVANAGSNQLIGGAENAADSTNTIALKGTFLRTAAAGALTVVEFDMTAT